MKTRIILFLFFLCLSFSFSINGFTAEPDEKQGRFLLTHKAYIPGHFDESILPKLWEIWPEPDRTQAAKLDEAARKKLIFSRYGIIQNPDSNDPWAQLTLVKNEHQQLLISCLTCHQGQVAGKVIPGVPNTLLDLHGLCDDVRNWKLAHQKPLVGMDYASLAMPMNQTRGMTNSVMFGVALATYRDKEMNIIPGKPWLNLIHHDMDAPPWWHLKKKKFLYIDGLAEKNPKLLLQFMLVKSNPASKIKDWGPDFEHVQKYIESLTPPKYPFPVDEELAHKGEIIFTKHCSDCHGTYDAWNNGMIETYPELTIPIDDIKTDSVRLTALSPEHRSWLVDSWLTDYGKTKVVTNPVGYVAPPLDGIWATAQYLHNGSVPTLAHMLKLEPRPTYWQRSTDDGYDQTRVGLEIKIFNEPPEITDDRPDLKRLIVDTSQKGLSNKGHDYPDILTHAEKLALLEYLKLL